MDIPLPGAYSYRDPRTGLLQYAHRGMQAMPGTEMCYVAPPLSDPRFPVLRYALPGTTNE
eukprot:1033875-Rhodomonas_salina.1